MTRDGVKPAEGQKCGYTAALSQITSLSFDLLCSLADVTLGND